MAARLSIIVPTHDGDGLDVLFESMADQLQPGDEVLVVGDTHDGPLPHIQNYVLKWDHRYIEHDAGHHCWGHCQINEGMRHAQGDYLVFIDDDDCFPDGALDAIRQAAAEQVSPRPLMFQFYSRRHGRTLPPRHEVKESAIGGHCMVTPNIPDRLGQWTCRYAGDYDWIVSTLALWPDGPAWYDDVIACA
jgi:glycosyltransferase involved in cell wall biosynthesis